MTLKHNELQDSIGEMLQKVTNDAKIEPILQPLTEKGISVGGNVSMKTVTTISTRTFFNVKIFNPNAQRHKIKTPKWCYETHEQEKKRDYNSRILNAEQGSLATFVFSVTGGMVRKSLTFIKFLCHLIATKPKIGRYVRNSMRNQLCITMKYFIMRQSNLLKKFI